MLRVEIVPQLFWITILKYPLLVGVLRFLDSPTWSILTPCGLTGQPLWGCLHQHLSTCHSVAHFIFPSLLCWLHIPESCPLSAVLVLCLCWLDKLVSSQLLYSNTFYSTFTNFLIPWSVQIFSILWLYLKFPSFFFFLFPKEMSIHSNFVMTCLLLNLLSSGFHSSCCVVPTGKDTIDLKSLSSISSCMVSLQPLMLWTTAWSWHSFLLLLL